MVNRNYVKGRAFEHAVRKHYESKGYTVIRSAGSKGKIDLIAWNIIPFCSKSKIGTITNSRLVYNPNTGRSEFEMEAKIEPSVKVIQCKIYDAKATKPLRTDLELLRAVNVPITWEKVLAWRVHGERKFKEEIV